ncbi:MAG: lysophospholipid acyltransferase family protein [Candidatus Saccharimonadales bacterium]
MKLRLMSISQIAATVLFRLLRPVYGNVTLHDQSPRFDPKQRYIFISNHRSKLDGPAIFSVFSLQSLWHIAPMKFMTASSIYHSAFRPLLASFGCYPHKIDGIDIIDYSCNLMDRGCNLMIFPEGKRVTRSQSEPKSGVIRLISQTKQYHPHIILVRIDWQRKGWRRFGVITVTPAPPNLDTSDARHIMDAIYQL